MRKDSNRPMVPAAADDVPVDETQEAAGDGNVPIEEEAEQHDEATEASGSDQEETGDEGFVSLYIEDEFWVLSAKGGYNKRRVFSRRFKQGKGKGKGSQRKRPGFRPRSQKKGKGYLTDDQVPDDQAFYGKKGKKGGKKGGKKQKDSFKSAKKGKTSKGDSSSSSGKANIAASSPSEEHVDAMEATAAGQDAWSEDYYWDSNYGCWVYFEQWDNQHESWKKCLCIVLAFSSAMPISLYISFD
eukprot:symbB.v1.2.039065.t1/scaffold6327.1/size18981/2